MLPLFPPGTLLTIHPVPPFGRLFGEVVLRLPACPGAPPFLHRVIHERERFLVTRGDAAAVDDPPVARSALLGIAATVVAGPVPRLSAFALARPRLFGMLAFALRPFAVAATLLDEAFHRMRGR